MFHCPPHDAILRIVPPVQPIDAGLIGFVFGVGFACLFFTVAFAAFFECRKGPTL